MKLWHAYESSPELAQEFSLNLKISNIISQILINRGLADLASAEQFLHPKLLNLTDPFLLPNVNKAIDRVVLAKNNNEKVVIYGDYDVDGVTGTVILLEALRHIGINPTYYIPHRYSEGYSLNTNAVKKFAQDKVGLIITVDCGISSIEEIKIAKELGIDVVITDHHNVPKALPQAVAVVNPKLHDSKNPSRDLSGAGVAFKFAWALLRYCGVSQNSFLTNLLDLACLGTIADVVPLTFENRIIAKQGLEIIKSGKRAGIFALSQAAGIKKSISVRDVNFGLAPRINAAGRLEHASMSVDLLISKVEQEARGFASELGKVNLRRQGIGESINTETKKVIEAQGLGKDDIIIVEGENWHPGVIGIIASRIADQFYRPTVLISINEGEARGSARSIDGFNVFNVLDSCKDLFNDFGGHEGAAGFEMDPDKIPELKKRLIEKVKSLKLSFTPKIFIDAEIMPEQATLNLLQQLQMLEPHGQGNPKPIFSSKGIILKDLRLVGGNGAHLKLSLSGGSMAFEAIGFGLANLKPTLTIGKRYDIAYHLETNEWNGFESVQFNLIDIILSRVSQDETSCGSNFA